MVIGGIILIVHSIYATKRLFITVYVDNGYYFVGFLPCFNTVILVTGRTYGLLSAHVT